MARWTRFGMFLLLLSASAGAAWGQAPIAVNDSASTSHNQWVLIQVLNNDQAGMSPLNPSSVTITQSAFGGSTQVNSNGTITYTPNEGYGGTDNFSYTVRNMMGQVSNAANVQVQVQTNFAPEIVDFLCEPAEGGVWLISGRVIDEHAGELTVTFGGLLAGCSTPVNEDGTFLLPKYIANPNGTISAVTEDIFGRISNTVYQHIGI